MYCLISIKDMLSISKLNEGKWDKIITVTKKILILFSVKVNSCLPTIKKKKKTAKKPNQTKNPPNNPH